MDELVKKRRDILIILITATLAVTACSESDSDPASSGSSTGDVELIYTVPPDDNDGWEIAELDLTEAKMENLLKGVGQIQSNAFGEIHSLLLVKGGQLVFERYFPGRNSIGQYIPFDRFTKHEVQSASKSYRSALIGIAIDRGFIPGIDVPLYDFFPDFEYARTEGKEKITLEHFLTMTSGLDWSEGSSTSPSTLSAMYAKPPNEWLAYVLERPLANEPGEVFKYNTGASTALNRVIMSSIETGFDKFVRDYYADLIESAELPGVAYPLHASTTPRDMAKFGYLFLYDGKWKNTQVISSDWVTESLKPRIQVNNSLQYGYQWWYRTLSFGGDTYEINYANGNGGQFVIIIRDLDLVLVSTGGKFGTGGYEIFDFISAYIFPAFAS